MTDMTSELDTLARPPQRGLLRYEEAVRNYDDALNRVSHELLAQYGPAPDIQDVELWLAMHMPEHYPQRLVPILHYLAWRWLYTYQTSAKAKN